MFCFCIDKVIVTWVWAGIQLWKLSGLPPIPFCGILSIGNELVLGGDEIESQRISVEFVITDSDEPMGEAIAVDGWVSRAMVNFSKLELRLISGATKEKWLVKSNSPGLARITFYISTYFSNWSFFMNLITWFVCILQRHKSGP